MSEFFNGFLCYTRQVPPPVCGESYDGVSSVVVPDDAIDIASVVKRMQRGEIVPLKQLAYGDDTLADADPTEIEEIARESLESQSETNKTVISDADSGSPTLVISDDPDGSKSSAESHETPAQNG